jgi:hypothetical protein
VDTTYVKSTVVESDVLNPVAKQVLGVKVIRVKSTVVAYDALNQVATKVHQTQLINVNDMEGVYDVRIVSTG